MVPTVHKYPIEPGLTTLQLPWGANPIHYAFQGDDAFVWVVLDPDKERILYSRYFVAVATGEAIALPNGMAIQRHIGTAVHPEGYVFHLFEVAG